MSFSAKITARRKHLGLTQQAVADRLGIAQPTYAAWESEKRRRPRIDTILKIAAVLKIAPGKLLNTRDNHVYYRSTRRAINRGHQSDRAIK